MQRRSFIAHDVDKTCTSLCDVLWKAVEVMPWELHPQTNQGIELVLKCTVEESCDYIHTKQAWKDKNTPWTPYYMQIVLIISLMMRPTAKQFIPATVTTIWLMVTY